MPASTTTDVRAAAFADAAATVHNGKYDYRLVPSTYRSAHEKVTIICLKHGQFQQTPASHKKGQGCPDCGGRVGASRQARLERFVTGAVTKHGRRYDYSQVDYVDQRTKVTIVCRDHGVFQQRPTNHLTGSACPSCAHGSRTEARLQKVLGVRLSQAL
ncbi:hypothetical protein HUN58_02255 [Curtobacterium sp. Csp1]|uniref:hypothetical protein n=1 Tax=Curtobacterium sp. Csp1 TaxID=2495429 RepID=UPI00159A7B65|nr:hypothetical protein [Curtobacterium sp. Csp1]QKS18881.1 hypothetical protein HUN58_02255 [Curtobacterium sp. Csp1]